jgi:type I restriction enzyme, S subunit
MPIEFRRDGPWELPAGWVWARADSFAHVIGGGTPKDASDETNFDPGGTPWITPADLSGYSKSHISRGARSLSAKGLSNSSARRLPAGSLLISSRAPVGYCVVASNEVTTNQGFKSLEFKMPMCPEFFRYYVIYNRSYFIDNASGTTFKELSGQAMSELLFPIAPVSEQRRIVARIDELFTEIADGETALTRARYDLATWRRALLKAAVTGELTREWRTSNKPKETGVNLVARVHDEKERASPGLRRGHRAEPDDDTDELSFDDLPDTWTSATFGELFNLYTGSTPSRSRRDYWGGNIPWVSSGEVAFCRIADTAEKITAAGLEASSTRLHPVGTVLLAMIGEGKTRGQPAILDIPASNNQNAAAIRVSETSILPEFVFHFLSYRYEKTRRAGQGGNQPALNLGKVSRIRMPIPPLVEMQEIVRLVHELRSALDDVVFAPKMATTEGKRLRQSLLKAAFEGRLVEQYPSSEPAKSLLVRVIGRAPQSVPASSPATCA